MIGVLTLAGVVEMTFQFMVVPHTARGKAVFAEPVVTAMAYEVTAGKRVVVTCFAGKVAAFPSFMVALTKGIAASGT